MMGDINEEEGYLTEDSGITPRVFDYLFKKIKLVRFSDCTRDETQSSKYADINGNHTIPQSMI